MIRDEAKDSILCRIIEKLQKSSLFSEMRADLQVTYIFNVRLKTMLKCLSHLLKTLRSNLKSFMYPINVNLEQFVWNPQLRSSVYEI